MYIADNNQFMNIKCLRVTTCYNTTDKVRSKKCFIW